MSTLQISLPEALEKKLKAKTRAVGVSNTAYVKILIARDLGVLDVPEYEPGNLFNADRDNHGQGLSLSEMKNLLIES